MKAPLLVLVYMVPKLFYFSSNPKYKGWYQSKMRILTIFPIVTVEVWGVSKFIFPWKSFSARIWGCPNIKQTFLYRKPSPVEVMTTSRTFLPINSPGKYENTSESKCKISQSSSELWLISGLCPIYSVSISSQLSWTIWSNVDILGHSEIAYWNYFKYTFIIDQGNSLGEK